MKVLDLLIDLFIFSTSFDPLPVAHARKLNFHCKCDISGTNRPRDSMLGSISSAGSVDVPFDNLDRNRSISGRACAKIVIFHCFCRYL